MMKMCWMGNLSSIKSWLEHVGLLNLSLVLISTITLTILSMTFTTPDKLSSNLNPFVIKIRQPPISPKIKKLYGRNSNRLLGSCKANLKWYQNLWWTGTWGIGMLQWKYAWLFTVDSWILIKSQKNTHSLQTIILPQDKPFGICKQHIWVSEMKSPWIHEQLTDDLIEKMWAHRGYQLWWLLWFW